MRLARVLLCVVGLAFVGYGVAGVLTADRGPDPERYLSFLVLGVLGHDLVFAPVSLVIGGLAAHWAPRGARGLILAGLFASAAVTLIALPFVLGRGYRPDIPSALPLNYGRGLAITLAGIWTGVALAGVLRWIARRRRG
ncbi:MAG: hypothetical protein ACRDTQ_18900 [Micromonosporaceae bacterium]